MTERKPAHETVPDFVERQIREAQERGDFDDLAGHGQPLPDLNRPDDELWWVRRKLRDEHLVGLPPALQARRERDEALLAVAVATSEETVRTVVEAANDRIRHINRTAISGPPTATMPLDTERVVAAWRARPRPAAPPTPAPAPPPRRRWSQRLGAWLRRR